MGFFSKVLGAGTGGLLGDDVLGLDLLGTQAAADAQKKAAGLQSDAIGQASLLTAESQAKAQGLIEDQLGITRGRFDPFISDGATAFQNFQQGSTAGGLDARLAEIMGGSQFGSLIDERTRAVQGQLSAGGLTRSGTAIQEAAGIPTDLAFQIENLLSGRQAAIADTGFAATGQLAGQESNLLNSIVQSITGGAQAQASGITGQAQAQASGILGAAQSQAAGTQNLLNLVGTIGGAFIGGPAGASAGSAIAGSVGGGSSFLAPQSANTDISFLSDPRLKKNIVKIGKVGQLNIYTWDYIDEIKDLGIATMESGFMSDEVKAVYPEHIHELGGYDLIDYHSVLDELEKEIH